MMIVPAIAIKRRLARNWAKCMSASGPYLYRVDEARVVINNKPHLYLESRHQYGHQFIQPLMFTGPMFVETEDGEEPGPHYTNQ